MCKACKEGFIKIALSGTDILADVDERSSDRANECTAELYRFDITTGTADFVTRCARSGNAWEQRIQFIDLNYILDEEEKLEAEPIEEGYEGAEIGEETPKIVTFDQLVEAHPEVLESDILVHCNCLVGDTKVPLLDGRVLTLEQLHEEFGYQRDFWVYSVDSKGDFVPGKARSLGVTSKVKRLYKITLDNGKSIRCTEDHPFMLRDGTYKVARLLNENDSLMPTVRKRNSRKCILCKKPLNKTQSFYCSRECRDEGRRQKLNVKNHKVKKIEIEEIENSIKVYDLSVEDHNNFLLEAGVIVHNCPAYLYQGYKYIMTELDTALELETRFPEIKNKDLLGTVCKHLIAVLRKYYT